ncbi:MAG TPA: TraR/DksA C4-type zinc finger protein [Gammaproteobacteria bacterium]|nr:TraR/DksA C4-type zinc finger protein [Gammaproteobacteria bacterium]
MDMPNAKKPSRAPSADARRRLLARSAEVRADIVRELRKCDDERYQELAGNVTDRGDESVADLLVDVDLAEIGRDVAELRDIEAALMRVAQGTYGTCVDCDASIDRARLESTPSAVRCVPCQQRFEASDRRERHRSL